MSKNFSNHLSKIKAPKVETPLHKRKLKNAVQSVYFNKDKSLKGSSLFDDLRNMSLKKMIPAGVLAIFAFTILGQNFMSWRNAAYAQELIEETIQKIESQPLEEIKSTIQILEELKKEGEIKYLGEEPYSPVTESGPERKIEKFSFTDEDFSSDLILNVIDQKEMNLMIDNPLQQSTYEDFEVKIGNNGGIINLEELKMKLKDPNLKKSWLKELIKMENKKWIEFNEKDLIPPLESIKKSNLINGHKKCDQQTRKIVEQLKPILKEAEVLIKGWNEGCADSAFWIFLLPVSGQQEKTKESQVEIQKLIDKLNQFETDSARMKIKILENALFSKRLRSYPNDNTFFSFPYTVEGDNQRLDLTIVIKPEDQTEDFIHIGFHPASFYSESSSIPLLSNQMEWVDVRLENGKISNEKELKAKLKDPNLTDETLIYFIQAQNQALFDEIMRNEVEQPSDEYGPIIFKQYDKEGKSELKLELLMQLKEILKDSEVPIIETSLVHPQTINSNNDWTVDEEQDPNVLYSLGIYSHDNPQPQNSSEAVEKLDGIIENLKDSINPENAATLEILKQALNSKDLKYEGRDEDGDQLSFSDPNIPNNIRLILKEDGQIHFTLDAPESPSVEEKLEIKIDVNNKITNLEQIESKLNDPNLKTPWIRELVRMSNYSWLQGLKEKEEYTLYLEDLSEEEKILALEQDKKNRALDEKCLVAEQAIASQMEDIIKNSEVSIQGSEQGCGEQYFSLYLYLFPVTERSPKINY